MHYSQSDRTKRRAAKIKSILGIYSEARRLHDSNSCDWLCWGMDQDLDERAQTEIWNIEMWIQDKEIQFGFYFLASWPVVTPNQWWHYIITMYWGLMGLLPLNSSQLLYRSNQAKSRAETSLRLSSLSHNPDMTPIIDRGLKYSKNSISISRYCTISE